MVKALVVCFACSAVAICPAVVRCQSVSAGALAQHTPQDAALNDNSRVVEMTAKGIDDEIVIAKIKASNWRFQLGDDDLLKLRSEGVSAKVVAAMVDASVVSVARVTVDDHPAELHTLGQMKAGGRLVNELTGDISSIKQKAFLQGPTSTVSAGPMPEIVIHPPRGDTIDNYVLVELDRKGNRRELEVGSVGGLARQTVGLRSGAVRPTRTVRHGDDSFELVPLKPLKHGEYMVYVIGSIEGGNYVYGRGYDFSVLR